MTDVRVELLAQGEHPVDPQAETVEWPAAAGTTPTMRSGLDWSVSQFGATLPQARDLLRVAAAAYLADRRARQPVRRLRRDLTLTVHVETVDAWDETTREHMVDLLHWLTGDDWALRCVPHTPTGPATATTALGLTTADDVSLLSGGLDSLCGALVRLRQPGSVFFLGHADSTAAVRHAQEHLQAHLDGGRPPAPYRQYALRRPPRSNEHHRGPRTRSLLFMSMAVAAATGMGAGRVLVPENGFTSINPPLEPSRGGPLTTRSTHPWTFHALGLLLGRLGLGHVQVTNPHAALTKGELLALAMPDRTAADQELAATTVSCAKLNAGRPKGGDAHTQCGLCIACLVRRGAFAGARLPDRTRHLTATLPPASRTVLLHHRRSLPGACLPLGALIGQTRRAGTPTGRQPAGFLPASRQASPAVALNRYARTLGPGRRAASVIAQGAGPRGINNL